eukprot:46802-Chlamydomonas_euryale.AAC.2
MRGAGVGLGRSMSSLVHTVAFTRSRKCDRDHAQATTCGRCDANVRPPASNRTQPDIRPPASNRTQPDIRPPASNCSQPDIRPPASSHTQANIRPQQAAACSPTSAHKKPGL